MIAVAVLASSAIAFADNGVSLSISPNAELTDRVQAVISVTYSCPSGWSAMTSSATIEQASGNQVASGTGYFSAQCTGANQTTTATILVSPSGPPFHPGSAVASGTLFAFGCDITGCNSGSQTVNTAVKLQ